MKHEGLGPNGGIIYALETLEANFEWLQEGLTKLGGIAAANSVWLTVDDYILFDCPGQVELFTHHDSLRHIFRKLEKLDYRVCLRRITLIKARRCESRRFVLLH